MNQKIVSGILAFTLLLNNFTVASATVREDEIVSDSSEESVDGEEEDLDLEGANNEEELLENQGSNEDGNSEELLGDEVLDETDNNEELKEEITEEAEGITEEAEEITEQTEDNTKEDETNSEETFEVEMFDGLEISYDKGEEIEPLEVPLVAPVSLEDNEIVIKGIAFSLGGDFDGDGENDYDEERLRIVFDTNNKRINLIERDGKLFSNLAGEYLKITLYSQEGEIKESVSVDARDRSDTPKLDIFEGLSYEEGDYLHIWHRESETKLNIEGAVNKVTGNEINDTVSLDNLVDFTQGVSTEFVENPELYRMRLSSDGLQLVENQKPTITDLTSLTIKRGEDVDLKNGLTIVDDIDTIDASAIEIDESTYDIDTIGVYDAELTIVDNWGLRSDITTRELNVEQKNNADSIKILVDNKLRIEFDEINKKLKATKISDEDFESDSSEVYFYINLYNRFGVVERKFEFKGDSDLNDETLKEINDYVYHNGGYISVWSKNPKTTIISGDMSHDAGSYNELTPEDYSDGIDDVNFMNNVRFKIEDGNFTSIYNYAPVLNGLNDITIKRGETVDLLTGITASDDHDGDITSKILNDYKEGTNFIEGTHKINYTVTDSWGRSTSQSINLIVEKANSIEDSRLELNVDGQTMLSMSIDSLDMRLKFEYDRRVYRKGNASDKAFNLALYDPFWNKVIDFPIMNDQSITNEMIERLTERNIVYGMKVHIYAADLDGVNIRGPLEKPDGSPGSDFSNGYLDNDMMNNTFFELTQDGVVEIYNEAPVIEGLTTVEILKGDTTFDFLEGVTVSDDLDPYISGFTYGITFDDSTVDYNTVGEYFVSYTTTDKAGRSIEVQRKINIVPELRRNEIVLEDGSNNRLFTIGFDKFGQKFTVDINNESNIEEVVEATEVVEPIFNIQVYNYQNVLIKEITINSNDDLSLLRGLEDIIIQNGYEIAISSNSPENLKVMGTLIKDSLITEESYEDGIQDIDFMNNVRFKISNGQLEAVYNEEPTIALDAEAQQLEFYMGERIDYYQDIIISDPDGEVSTDNVEIYVYDINNELILDEEGNPKKLTIDTRDMFSEPRDYRLLYIVTDENGRTSSLERTVTVLHGMLRHSLNLGGFNGKMGNNGYVQKDMAFITFEQDQDGKLRLVYTVDEDLYAENPYFNYSTSGVHYYNIDLLDSNGVSKLLNGEVAVTGASNKKMQGLLDLNGILVENGDTLIFNSSQGQRVSFDGEMYNTGNNYSEGIVRVYDLATGGLEVSDYGFIENEPIRYDNSGNVITPGENEVWIELYNYFAGNMMIRLRIDLDSNLDGTNPQGVQISVDGGINEYGFTTEGVYQLGATSGLRAERFFRLEYWNEDGSIKQASNADGDIGYDELKVFRSDALAANNKMDYGDYIQLEIDTEHSGKLDESEKPIADNYKNYITILGNVKYPEGFTDDFSNGVDEIEFINNTKLILTKDGLVVDYNEEPVIHTEDVDIIKGQAFDPLDGVTATDDKDGTIEQINVTGTVDINTVGVYELTYSVEDSLGRESELIRTVRVRDEISRNIVTVFSEDDSENPVFTIEINDLDNKYEVNIEKETSLTTGSNLDKVFEIVIYDDKNNVKYSNYIQTNEIVNGITFESISEVNYEDGDVIKLFRSLPNGLNELTTLTIDGDILNAREDYSDGVQDVENLYNVTFKAHRETGLESIYNDAPVISGLVDKLEFFKDDTLTNSILLEGVTVNDTQDGEIDKSEIVISNPPNFNRTGTYETVFSVTDSDGRTTSKVVEITILSNILNNAISINTSTEEKFTINFNRDSKFNVNKVNEGQIEDALTINIYNRFNELVKSIDLSNTDTADSLELLELNELLYENYYYISFVTNADNMIKIQGKVIETYDEQGRPVLTTIYENGLTAEQIGETRFYVLEDGLYAVNKYNEATISGLTPLTVVRGDESVNLREGVTVTHTTEEFQEEHIQMKDFNLYEEGQYDATYFIVDSWGNVFEETREITVLQRDDVERNVVTVKNPSNGEVIFEVKFDTINMKMRAIRKSDSDLEGSFTFDLYSSSGMNISSIKIDNDNLNDKIAEINEIDVEYLNMFNISRDDAKNGLSIEGYIKDQLEDYTDGVDNLDYIENVRFEIDLNNLVAIHNEAPVITGVSDKDIYIGDNFDPYIGLIVTDDKDGIIASEYVTIEGRIDTAKIGPQNITYRVKDTWGRETTKTIEVYVLARIENTNFDIYSKQNLGEKLISITFDGRDSLLKVERSVNNASLDSTKLYENIFTINIFRNNESVKEIVLAGNSDNTSLNELDNFKFEYGDMIEVNIEESLAEANPLYTKGMFKVSGELYKDEEITEDYSDGIDNIDFIQNVRFEIMTTGIQIVYNEAPVLKSILEAGSTIERYISRDLEDYKLLDGFTVTDDKDRLDTRDAIIVHADTKEPISLESLNDIIVYPLEYYILDSWGRKSNTIRINLKLNSSINLNTIEFSRIYNTTTNNNQVDRLATKIVEIQFNHVNDDGGTFEFVYDRDEPNMNKSLLEGFETSELHMYSMKHVRGSTTLGNIEFAVKDIMLNRINEFEGAFTEFEYGDKIILTSSQGPNIAIQGSVFNQTEDYSDGIHLGNNLMNTEFTITKQGLVANMIKERYSEYDSLQVFNRLHGLIMFNISADTDQKIFLLDNVRPTDTSSPGYDWYHDNIRPKDRLDVLEPLTSSRYFTINHYNADGTLNGTITTYGSDYVDSPQTSAEAGRISLQTFFRNRSFEFGDYLTIDLTNTRGRSEFFAIKPGDVYHQDGSEAIIEGLGDKDYEYAVQPEDLGYFNSTRFYLTENGITAEANTPPQIIVPDAVIMEGQPFDPLEGVSVYDPDPWDADLTVSDVSYDESVDTSIPGAYTIEYSITDNRGFTTIYDRFVIVNGRPVIDQVIESTSIELNSIEGQDALEAYLKSLVRAFDFEDGEITHKVTVSTELNPNEVGRYDVTYSVVDSEGYESNLTIQVDVVKTINVTVPINNSVPFQLITNLINGGDPFISGILALGNNNQYSEVEVSVQSFSKIDGTGELEIVSPDEINEELSKEESMKKMSLGIFGKGSINTQTTKEEPIWLTNEMESGSIIGSIPKAIDATTPTNAKISFSGKYGNEFLGGTTLGQFNLILRFD